MFWSSPVAPSVVCTFAAVLLALGWIGIHLAGVIRLHSLGPDNQPDRPLVVAWAVSAVSGVLGPCALIGSVAGLVMTLRAIRECPKTRANRIAGKTALLANGLMLVAVALVVAGALASIARTPGS